jgi:hypothetical protein
MPSQYQVEALKTALARMGPERFVRELGFTRFVRAARTVRVPCPVHNGKDPNCSVFLGNDGELGFVCFSACGHKGGDALAFVAAVRGLDLRTSFPHVLEEAARLAGITLDLSSSRDSDATISRRLDTERRAREAYAEQSRRREAEQSTPKRAYPSEVATLWSSCGPVTSHPKVVAYLESRKLDPLTIAELDLARAIPNGAILPPWACFSGHSWIELGYLLVVPVFDPNGHLRSIRATRVIESNTPKRIAPAGFSASGLVMADTTGRLLLQTGSRPPGWPDPKPFCVVVTEGETDFLTWATRFSDASESAPAVLGVFSGSWTPEIAQRMPDSTRVIIRTDHDPAGDRYAEQVRASLAPRCEVRRDRS